MKPFNKLHKYPAVFRIEVSCWFISQKYFRIRNYCPDKSCPLLFPDTQFVGVFVFQGFK